MFYSNYLYLGIIPLKLLGRAITTTTTTMMMMVSNVMLKLQNKAK